MSTLRPDPPEQTAFLTSASSSLATITTIDNVGSSAQPTSESSVLNGQPSQVSTVLPAPTVPGATPSSTTPLPSSPIVTGLTRGGKIGVAIGSAAVFAILLWWFWPKRHRTKKKLATPTSLTQEIKQSSVTTEVKKTDEKRLPARVKTV